MRKLNAQWTIIASQQHGDRRALICAAPFATIDKHEYAVATQTQIDGQWPDEWDNGTYFSAERGDAANLGRALLQFNSLAENLRMQHIARQRRSAAETTPR